MGRTPHPFVMLEPDEDQRIWVSALPDGRVLVQSRQVRQPTPGVDEPRAQHEWARMIAAAEVPAVVAALGEAPGTSPLDAAAWHPETFEHLGVWLAQRGLPSLFWEQGYESATERNQVYIVEDPAPGGGGRWVWVSMRSSGKVSIQGQDLRMYEGGVSEYEWACTIAAADVPKLYAALGEPADAPLLEVARRHAESLQRSTAWLREHDIPFDFWAG